MANNRFSLESVKGMTIELQSKSKRERSLHQNLCDLEHFWQLVKPVRNSMISTVKLLFLKMNSGPPQCLEMGMFGCTLFWIIFENPKCIILKSFFQWKPWSLQSLSHPLAEEHRGSAVSRPPHLLKAHLLVQVPGDIKIFLECPEKCRTNPILLSSFSWFWWEFTWINWQNCRGKKDCRFT